MCLFSTIVLSQPDDATVCEGRQAVFSCVLNSNVGNNTQWYRFINDTSTEMVVPSGGNFAFINTANNSAFNTSLTITSTTKSHTGYYWVRTSSSDICNASLTVVTSMWVYTLCENQCKLFLADICNFTTDWSKV